MAWRDQLVAPSKQEKDEATRRFLERKRAKGEELTEDQQRAEQLLGSSAMSEPSPLLPNGPLRTSLAVDGERRTGPHSSSDESKEPNAWFVEAARLKHLLPGSSKPHATPQDQSQHQRVERWAHSGSLRQLEPESPEKLKGMPMPRCNIPPRSDPEKPPPRIANAPGPFTTAQLIPEDCQRRVKQHGHEVRRALMRARRGDSGWKEGRQLRPEALILSESEALNECGWGYTWKKRANEDLWDVVQPSCYPEDPPDTTLNVPGWEALIKQFGLKDQQLFSWVKHGFPGVDGMPRQAVIGYPHVGALKNAEAFEEMNQRDIKNGFVSHGQDFPEIWPCICDPMNLVIQKGKPRATIDKTMNLSSSDHPDPVLAYNDFIKLEIEREIVGRLSLPTTSIFSRGAAILLSCGLVVKGGKFDLQTYFRIHGKQRSYIHQSGRVLETLFGIDSRVNFGEKDAPDHCCRGSSALAHFVRSELRRLTKEYPSRAPQVIEWLVIRMGLAKESGEENDPDFIWLAIFFFIFYIDDAGLAVICDGPLYNTKGEPKIEIITLNNGQTVKIHQERPELYYAAAMGIVQLTGHGTPEKKQDPMTFRFELLGIDVDLTVQKQLLSLEKRRLYSADVRTARAGTMKLDNGLVAAPHDFVNSLIHKLTFAAIVIAIGKMHLFYCRAALHAPNRLGKAMVIIDTKADKELEWWEAQLAKSEEHGVPLASRFDFPCSDENTIARYSDASREETKPVESGFGAWAVVREVFVYIEGRWSAAEVKAFSINVLEAKAANMGGVVILNHAKAKGCEVTHTLAYVDNSTAENIAERGRTTTESLHDLNLERHEWLLEHGIVESTERVASIDNDVADLLSRGSIEEALRFPKEAKLPILRLEIPKSVRSTANLKPTWE